MQFGIWRMTLVAFALVMSLVSFVTAGDHGCARCGCSDCCKVCRLVEEEKKVPVICWGCVCEDMCLPCPSERGCKHCDRVCEDCNCGEGLFGCGDCSYDPKHPTSKSKKFVWFDWCPGEGKRIIQHKKLMKMTTSKKIPHYKWVVEDLCAKCEKKVAEETPQVAPGSDVPPPPALADAKLIPELTR